VSLMPLETLRSGEEGLIEEIDGEPAFVHRLAEMGLQVGSLVRMVRPGSACIVQLGPQRLSFRMDGRATIWVELARTAAGGAS
jgi:ferrous iron transport protein A